MADKVLVTGGAGYIGSHCVKQLLDSDYQVIALDNLSEGHRDLVLCDQLIEGDIGDRKLLNEVFENHDIDAVMHFAAHCKVPESVENPIKYYRNNVVKSLTLLDAMAQYEVKKLIFSSSAAVYGDPQVIPIPEDHEKSPRNPYGRTKWIFEQILEDYRTGYGISSVSLRYFNAAGSDPEGDIGEWHEPETHLIPIVLEVAAGQRDKLSIYGTDYDTPDGSCVRDFVHVFDLVQAHLAALDQLNEDQVPQQQAYNLGTGEGYSVKEVLQVCREVTGKQIPAEDAERRPGDPPQLVADPSRAKEELGWTPRFEDLSSIVETAWDWLRKLENRKSDVEI
ncbi:MAG: UDP-glucose 4-epimerase GalE [Candidatus Bipolaricaulota bacterium]